MGYEDRDYMQSERGGGNSFILPGYPACRFLIIATLVVFVAQILFVRNATVEDFADLPTSDNYLIDEMPGDGPFFEDGSSDSMEDVTEEQRLELQRFQEEAFSHVHGTTISPVEQWCQLDTDKVMGGQIWRLVTSAFLHSRFGVWHILINMIVLYWFGRDIEDLFGSRELIAFYFAAAIFSGLVFVAMQLWLGERIPAIGASGAVMAVFCLFAMYNPSYTIHFRLFFPIQVRYLLLIYVLYDLHPVLMSLAGTPLYTGTAHTAHLGGLLFGFLYYRQSWRVENWIDSFRSIFARPGKKRTARPRRITARGRELDDQRVGRMEKSVDEILEKISNAGMEALTEKERKTLEEAGRQYRRRKPMND